MGAVRHCGAEDAEEDWTVNEAPPVNDLGHDPDEGAELILDMDTDGDGFVSKEEALEFIAGMAGIPPPGDEEDGEEQPPPDETGVKMAKAFKDALESKWPECDANGDGKLDKVEILKLNEIM